MGRKVPERGRERNPRLAGTPPREARDKAWVASEAGKGIAVDNKGMSREGGEKKMRGQSPRISFCQLTLPAMGAPFGQSSAAFEVTLVTAVVATSLRSSLGYSIPHAEDAGRSTLDSPLTGRPVLLRALDNPARNRPFPAPTVGPRVPRSSHP